MVAKTQIIGELGQEALLLPELLGRALKANERIKLTMALLQAAEGHADHPDRPLPSFGDPVAAGLGELDPDRALAESRRQADGALLLPGAARLRALMLEDVAAMAAPLALARAEGAAALAARRAAIEAALPDLAGDLVPAGLTDALTRADHRHGDSLHLLVMDLHRAINTLQAELAEEDVDGARAWRIDEADRPLLRAFMAGLNRTAPLKFDHPGLGTTATRVEGRLLVQNDIGTTDAHVLVVQVDGPAVTVTYTDVHAARLDFFRSLFRPFAVRWEETSSRHGEHLAEEANYYLSVGRFEAADRAGLERYLDFLGSRIVFLIDWNRARKRLREFLRKEDVVPVLKWAADQNLGHRGFLQLGGERLLYEAMEFAQQTPLRYGEHLDEAIGPEAAVRFMKFVLRATAEGLLQGRSERFIRDEIRAELAGCFKSAQENLLQVAADHAVLVFELASEVRDGLAAYGEPGFAEQLDRTARRAGKWEQSADMLVSRMRALVQRAHTPAVYLALLREADDAADGLEEVSFLLTLLPRVAPAGPLLEPVEALAGLLVAGAQELVKLIETASHVHRDGAREDLQDFLEAVDRIVGIEHETDAAERAIMGALILGAADFRAFQLLAAMARALEGAADALSRTALILRDHLLNAVVAG